MTNANIQGFNISEQVIQPQVSVCIPIYNGAKYLHDCIQSVTNQSFQNIEILFIDDRSSDESVNIIQQYQKNDSRIRLIINETNLGLVGNWNKCIKTAKADWIKFLFQDDELATDCIKKMFSACCNDQTLIGLCGRRILLETNAKSFLIDYFSNESSVINKIIKERTVIYPSYIAKLTSKNLINNFIGEPITLLFHKKVVADLGYYNEDMTQLVDYEFILRIGLNYPISFLPEELVSFRVHTTSASGGQSVNEIRKTKSQFVDQIILFHEQLYNPYFKKLKAVTGHFKLLKAAVFFYQNNNNRYKNFKKLKRDLKHYKHISRFNFYSVLYSIVQKVLFKS